MSISKSEATTKRRMSAAGAVVFGVLFLVMPSARADGLDPHIIYATGGDAMDITTAGVPITLSPTGGGIFVFHNATGGDVSKIDVSLLFATPTFPPGFVVDPTISPTLGASSVFSSTELPNSLCDGSFSSTSSCLEMVLNLMPGSFIANGQNFVLDFDAPDGELGYIGIDAVIASGLYTGGTDTSDQRIGEWPSGATGEVVPVAPVPEPGTLTMFGFGLAVVVARVRQRRA